MDPLALLPPALAFGLSPLLPGVVNRVKAVAAGRVGPPLLQGYFDLAKLVRKGAVYSHTATALVRAGPALGLAALAVGCLLLPLGPVRAPLAFAGDLVLFVALLALQRFFLMVSALDTGSSFEGMGASREAFFSALAEPALLLALIVAVRGSGSFTLSGILGASTLATVVAAGPALLLVAAAVFLVFLAENARVPVDDPSTHLELTMIHEVMVLDHGGVDLAYLTYAASLKLWAVGALLVGLVLPLGGAPLEVALPAFLAGMLVLACAVGVIESATARMRMTKVPRLLVGAGGLAALALLLVIF